MIYLLLLCSIIQRLSMVYTFQTFRESVGSEEQIHFRKQIRYCTLKIHMEVIYVNYFIYRRTVKKKYLYIKYTIPIVFLLLV